MAAWAIAFEARPDLFPPVLNRSAASGAFFRSQVVRAHALGKGKCLPEVGQVRLILPTGPLLQLIDILVARDINHFCESMMPHSSLVWLGSDAGTQVLDIAHGAALALEKAQDGVEVVSAAAADVLQCYDTIRPHEGCSSPFCSWSTSSNSLCDGGLPALY